MEREIKSVKALIAIAEKSPMLLLAIGRARHRLNKIQTEFHIPSDGTVEVLEKAIKELEQSLSELEESQK